MNKKSRLFLVVMLLMILVVIAGCGESTTENQAASNSGVTKQSQTAPGNVTNTQQPEAGENIVPTTASEPEKKQEQSTAPADKNQSSKDPVGTAKSSSPVTQGTKTDNHHSGRVGLVITRDFGQNTLLEKQAELKKDGTVFDLLESYAQVTTGGGGGLIMGINGLKSESGGLSGKRNDWFYFVNGICADVGAQEYKLQAGDTVWWDYHGWTGMGMVNSAVIGSYPEPFLHGYRGQVGPTMIMTYNDGLGLAGEMEKALKAKGVSVVRVKALDENLLKNRQGPTIVVGEWNQLQDYGWLENINQAYRKNGTSVHFTREGLELLDYAGKVGKKVTGSAGVIVVTGEGLGCANPLWLVAGTDREGVEQAVNILVKRPGDIAKMYGAAVISGKVIRLPLGG